MEECEGEILLKNLKLKKLIVSTDSIKCFKLENCYIGSLKEIKNY